MKTSFKHGKLLNLDSAGGDLINIENRILNTFLRLNRKRSLSERWGWGLNRGFAVFLR
jgi:hypothetical protein